MKTKENQLGQVSLRSIRSIAANRGQSRSNQALGSQPNTRDVNRRSVVRKLLNGKFFWRSASRLNKGCHKNVVPRFLQPRFWTVTHLSDTLAERRRIGKRYRVSLSISVGAVCYQRPVLDDAASPN